MRSLIKRCKARQGAAGARNVPLHQAHRDMRLEHRAHHTPPHHGHTQGPQHWNKEARG